MIKIGGLRKCLLFVPLFALLFQGFFLGSYVSAASPYDNTLQVTKTLIVKSPNGNHKSEDLSTSYVSFLNDCDSSFKDSFSVALDNGSGWVVSQNYSNSNDSQTVLLQWVENPSDMWTYFDDLAGWGGTAYFVNANDKNTKVRTLQISLNNSNDLQASCFFNFGDEVLSTSPDTSFPAKKLWLANTVVNYPPGYAGIEVPSARQPIASFKPSVDFAVDSTRITAKYNDNIPGACYAVWSILNSDSEVIEQSFKKQTKLKSYKFKVKGFGQYSLFMTVTYDVPCAPKPADVEIIPVFVPLNIDGTSYSGSTDDLDCDYVESNSDDSGAFFCEQPSLYEDCSTYGVDIVGGFGCVIRNFGVFLKSMLIALFVPSPDIINDLVNSLIAVIRTKLGFLFTPIDFIADISTTIFSGSTNCSIDLGNLFGGNFQFNACNLSNINGTIWTFLQLAMQATVLGLMMFALFRKLQAIFKEEK